jgi:hypothetical protein
MFSGAAALLVFRPFQLAHFGTWIFVTATRLPSGTLCFEHVKCLDPMCLVKEKSQTLLEKETRCL